MFVNQSTILNNALAALSAGSGVTVDGSQLHFEEGPVALRQGFADFVRSAFTAVNQDEESDLIPGAADLLDLIPDELNVNTEKRQILLTEFSFQEFAQPEDALTESYLNLGLKWQFAAEASWEVFPELITLSAVEAHLLWVVIDYDDPELESDHDFSARLTGNLAIEETAVDVQISMPDFSVALFVRPAAGAWTVTTLLDFFSFDDLDLDQFPLNDDTPFKGLSVASMSLTGDVQTRSLNVDLVLSSTELALSSGSDPMSDISLRDIALRISYSNGEVQGFVEGKAQLGEATVGVVAQYSGATAGWLFNGWADLGTDGLPVVAWLDQFSELFSFEPGILSPLSSLNLRKFDTSFALGGEAGGLRDLRLGCELRIGELPFKFAFISSDGGSRFVGTYLGDSENAVDLGPLLNDFFPQDQANGSTPDLSLIPPADLTIASLFLASQPGKPDAAVLFGLDLANKIDFSGLMLAGEHLGQVGLSYQLLIASTDMTAEQLTAVEQDLQQLGSEFPALLPASDGAASGQDSEAGEEVVVFVQGLNLIGAIDLGQHPIPLLAPLAANTETAEAATTTPAPVADDQAPAPPENIHWLPIGRTLGPLYLAQIGFSLQKGAETRLKVSLDAVLDIGVLYFALQGLSVSSPLDRFDPSALRFGLEGFALGSRSEGVEISGQFALAINNDQTEFVGSAEIKAQTFAITAMGAFQEMGAPGQYALFLYAALDQDIGGPAFFYVTGLSLGFGYNRQILLPESALGVAEFELVAPLKSGTPGAGTALDQARGMAARFPAQPGAYWIAAGVKFKSFQMIESIALLVARFDRTLDISLMGVSTLTLPRDIKTGASPYAVIQLAFQISVKPRDGVAKAEGVLTDSSYLISPDARLGGGFAFYTWFGDHPKAGDFVLTVGGYHPRYARPSHYPVVPRLSLNWPLNDQIKIKGEAYLALTPAHIMAGGKLHASYRSGPLSASFIAHADFLIQWEPFTYDAEIGVQVSASYDAGVLGVFAIELSANLHLWGPEMAGLATVSWEIFSFEVPIGNSNYDQWLEDNKAKTVTAAAFAAKFLPEAGQRAQILIHSGLERKFEREVAGTGQSESIWVVRSEALELSTESAIPITHLNTFGTPTTTHNNMPTLGIQPMGGDLYESHHSLTLSTTDGDSAITWQAAQVRQQQVPAALWDPAGHDSVTSTSTPKAKTLMGITGIQSLRPSVGEKLVGATGEFELRRFQFDELEEDKALDLVAPSFSEQDVAAGMTPATTEEEWQRVIPNSAMADDVIDRRIQLLLALEAAGFDHLGDDSNLTELKNNASHVFQDGPMIGPLGRGGSQPPSSITVTELPPLAEEVTPEEKRILVYLLASLWLYKAGKETDAANTIADVDFAIVEPGQAQQKQVISPADRDETPVEPETAAPDSVASQPLHPAEAAGNGNGAATGPDSISATRGEPLVVGKTMLWEIRPEKDAPATRLMAKFTQPNGSNPDMQVRVVELDQYSQLLSNAVHPLDNITLREKTAFLAVSGVKPVRRDNEYPVVGWHGRSTLLQLRPRTLVVDEVLIQPQTPRRLSHRGRHYAFGLTTGEAMARENVIRTEDGEVAPGWIKTRLPSKVLVNDNLQALRTIAVLVKRQPEDDQTTPEIEVNIPESNPNRTPPLGLSPLPNKDATEIAYLYRVSPAVLSEGQEHLTVKVRINDPNWQLEGVMSFAAPEFLVRQRWQQFKLHPLVIEHQPDDIASDGLLPNAVRVELGPAGEVANG